MTRYVLTANTFKGSAEVWYNFDGMLCRVELICADLNFDQIKYLLRSITPDLASAKTILESSNLTVKEVPFEIPTAEDFLREYGYNRNTHLVKAMWPSLDKKTKLIAFFRAIEYRGYCKAN